MSIMETYVPPYHKLHFVHYVHCLAQSACLPIRSLTMYTYSVVNFFILTNFFLILPSEFSCSDHAIESLCEMVPDYIQMDRRNDIMTFNPHLEHLPSQDALSCDLSCNMSLCRMDQRVILIL